ncbi:MerC domain-containing protein [Coralloluteibacterium stylophorae]|uniref:MerC domain-containing protein n=1 Tax=Coralloluteibacterium stylophorae TaxID=1776034 RepID=A0A8J7VWT7_9GAMM|nr:MerC domain-containing protein [Coralloluteibacterium stylophorae]MBS7456524.1 MerC domain-containing protein [Coralloluteibacterium stylophorae]
MGFTSSAARVQHVGDRVGFAGSLLCAVHCAVLPVLLAVAPALGLKLVAGVDLDQAIVVFTALLGVAMLAIGYRRHRALRPALLLLAGLALLLGGAFGGAHEHSLAHAAVMTVGGVLVAAGHLLNLRLGHAARR